MKVSYILATIVVTLVAPVGCAAQVPCDFKGVSVGDKMPPREIMAAFGITKYKTNPKFHLWDATEENVRAREKYGLIGATELEEWDIGPYCDDTSCRIPQGVGVGNHDTPVNVFVSFRKEQIVEIDVAFSTTDWEEIVPILDRKYGSKWEIERNPEWVTVDPETKKRMTWELIELSKKGGGKNLKTGDECQIWARNYDMIHEHSDPMGPYHSVLAIKLVSKNF